MSMPWISRKAINHVHNVAGASTESYREAGAVNSPPITKKSKKAGKMYVLYMKDIKFHLKIIKVKHKIFALSPERYLSS